MINKYVDFYYCIKSLKRFNLRLDFDAKNKCSVLCRTTGKQVAEFYSMDSFFGFCECLQLIDSATINVDA